MMLYLPPIRRPSPIWSQWCRYLLAEDGSKPFPGWRQHWVLRLAHLSPVALGATEISTPT